MRRQEKIPVEEGQVKDLVEKLKTGELTRKEALKILKERGLKHGSARRSVFYTIGEWMVIIIWVVLCFIYVPFKLTNSSFLDSFDRLPTIVFPISVIYLSIILFIASIVLQAYVSWYRKEKGGLTEGDPVILVKEGPYAVVRHPSNVLSTITFVTLPIVISSILPFTVLSGIGIIILTVGMYWGTLLEEKYETLRKWGDDYRQYMNEVPSFNFIKGLWNLWKRR